jgi:uncharacterized RDD family membrane protein YckC
MQEPLPNISVENIIADGGLVEGLADELENASVRKHPTSTLIEFPGTSRPLPEWRKQLSQRVREVQERRAREAAEEAAAAREAGALSCSLPSAQLELVPDLEQPVMNPIVSKALERIERARRSECSAGGYSAAATAPALEHAADVSRDDETSRPEKAESKPRLTMVASPPPLLEVTEISEDTNELELDIELDSSSAQNTAEPDESPKFDVVAQRAAATYQDAKRGKAFQTELELTALPRPVVERKPVRMISDSVNDVALSYLETCLALPALSIDAHNEGAGFGRRFVAGTMDLFFVALMIAPAVAAIQFSDGNWHDSRVIGLMSGITVVTMFAYFTVSIALTGRTLAMRLCSLRAIDLRTGLIPTGGQSIKRAAGYIVALALLGLGILYAFIDRDRRTVYDRFSRTIVIRD